MRNILDSRLRRRFNALLGQAKARTSGFPRFVNDYAVHQKTTGSSVVWSIENVNPRFEFFEEDTKAGGKMRPWGPGDDEYGVNDWSNRHTANPFLIARHVQMHGTKGKHYLRDVWDENFDDLESTMLGAVDAFMQRFLLGSLAQD
jgi:hypothetical protein